MVGLLPPEEGVAGRSGYKTSDRLTIRDQKGPCEIFKSHCMNFIVTQEMPMPKEIPEKFMEFGL